MPKKAYLVTFKVTTRVEVDTYGYDPNRFPAAYQAVVNAACERAAAGAPDWAENVSRIEPDTECPCEGQECDPTGEELRILVVRGGDCAVDVLSVRDSLLQDRFRGSVPHLLNELYGDNAWDTYLCGPIRGFPVRVMEFSEEDDTSSFMREHHADERKFI